MIFMNKSYLLSVIVPIALFVSCVFNCNSYLERQIKPLMIEGGVIQKSRSNNGCFGSIIIRQKKSVDTLRNICYCVPETQALWDYITPGDSVYKNTGSTIVKIIRGGVEKTFDFPCCSR